MSNQMLGPGPGPKTFAGPGPGLGTHTLTFLTLAHPTFGTPKIYTSTGFGPRQNREMAGVDHLVVYMQTAVKYNTFYIHHPGGVQLPRGGVYTNCCIL